MSLLHGPPGEAGISAFRDLEMRSRRRGQACYKQDSYLYLLSCLARLSRTWMTPLIRMKFLYDKILTLAVCCFLWSIILWTGFCVSHIWEPASNVTPWKYPLPSQLALGRLCYIFSCLRHAQDRCRKGRTWKKTVYKVLMWVPVSRHLHCNLPTEINIFCKWAWSVLWDW